MTNRRYAAETTVSVDRSKNDIETLLERHTGFGSKIVNRKERPDWVKARANCTLEGTFEQIVDAVKHDIACFNKLPSKQQPSPKAGHCQPDTRTAYFGYVKHRGIQRNDHVAVHMTGTTIQILRNADVMFEVEREWNEETLTCDLKVNGTVLTLWQISQKALGPYLFE